MEPRRKRGPGQAVTALRDARRRRGLYQYQAAESFFCSEFRWSRYETGSIPIPEDLLAQVALAWREPRLLLAHPCVAAYRALGGAGGDPDPDPATPKAA